MDIYLVRHTTPKIEKGICYGQSDLDLADNYSEEFKAVLNKIPKKNNYQVISSPLKRCDLLANAFETSIVYDERLKELNFGDWELMPWNDIPKEKIDPWMKDFVKVQVPNGESYVQLAARVTSFLKDLIASEDNKNTIIVSHAGPIRALLAGILDIPLEKSFSINIQYGDVFHLRKESGSLKVISEIDIR